MRYGSYGGHAPGHVRDAFCKAVYAFHRWDGTGPEPKVEFEVNYQPTLISLSEACGLVWNCTDVLPGDLWHLLEELVPNLAPMPPPPARCVNG